MNAIVPAPSTFSLVPRDMNSAMQLANLMATSKLVPVHLQRSPGDCLLVIEQAGRWGMSPFAVAQCSGVVKGKLSYEGKLVAAAINTSGVLSGRLEYKFTGSGEGRKVIVSGLLRGESVAREVEVALTSARTDNEHWRKSPDQMLTYHAARVWGRRHTPEVMLGVYAPEEFDAGGATTPEDSFKGTTIEATSEPPAPPAPTPEPPRRRTWADLLDAIDARFTAAETRDEVDEVLASDEVQKALDGARNGAKERLDGIIRAAMAKTETPVDNAPEHGAAPAWDAGKDIDDDVPF